MCLPTGLRACLRAVSLALKWCVCGPSSLAVAGRLGQAERDTIAALERQAEEEEAAARARIAKAREPRPYGPTDELQAL